MYSFYVLAYTYQGFLPKQARFSIGTKILQTTLALLELILRANRQQTYQKNIILKEADIQLQMLKMTVRLTYDCKSLDQEKYLRLEKSLQEIGKMLGGWMKDVTK